MWWRRAVVGFACLVAFGCGDDDGGVDAGRDAAVADTGRDVAPDVGEDAALDDVGADVGDADRGPVNVLFPRTGISAEELGVVVNEDDPQSVAVAARYVEARGIPEANVVRVSFPVQDEISLEVFEPIRTAVAALPGEVQGLAVTWTRPYRVDCMSVTSALAFGFNERFCSPADGSCEDTAASPLFASDLTRPFDDFRVRPAMMLAGVSEEEALALIDRGLAADGTLPEGKGYLVRTSDFEHARRWPTFVEQPDRWTGLALTYVDNSPGGGSDVISGKTDLMFYFTGLTRIPELDSNTYAPGSVIDNYRSVGTPEDGVTLSALRMLEAGATGSYGTVGPCPFQNSSPNLIRFLEVYFRGATLLQAYWSSVNWPGEGLFVGDPLARPFERQVATVDGDTVVLETNAVLPGDTGWVVQEGPSADGPWTVLTLVEAEAYERQTIRVPRPAEGWLRLTRGRD